MPTMVRLGPSSRNSKVRVEGMEPEGRRSRNATGATLDDGRDRPGRPFASESGGGGAGGSRRSGSGWPQVPAPTLHVALAALPLLAFVPVLYYSLTTPLGLIDDYRELQSVELLDDPRLFLEWCRRTFLDPRIFMYRPFFDLYSAFTAKIFGAEPWLHHLARWVVHFAAVFLFAAAFLRFSRRERADERSPSPSPAEGWPLLPLALLVHLWIFYPNVPAARLMVMEVQSVFFLGLCGWTFACLLRPAATAAATGSRLGRQTPRAYGLFLLAVLGLSLSKETNVAPLLWILIAYGAFLAAEPGSPIGKLARGAPLALIFGFTLSRVHAASQHHEIVDVERFAANLQFMLRDLFLLDTSVLLAAAFVILSAALLLVVAARLFLFRRLPRAERRELLFVLFLLGQFFSLYFVLALSPVMAPRYRYILVPCFATLLAFGARFTLVSLAGLSAALRRAAAAALAAFVCFFILVNYHNFLFQTVVQNSLRRTESDLIGTVNRLLDGDQRVQIRKKESPLVPFVELIDSLGRYYRDFQPRFLGRRHLKAYAGTDADFPYWQPASFARRRTDAMHAESPPLETDQPRWVVSLYGSTDLTLASPSQNGGLRVVDMYGDPRFVNAPTVTFVPRLDDYRLLSWAGTVSGFLQGEAPRAVRDYGVQEPGDKSRYGWVVYHAPYDVDEWMAGLLSRIIARAGEPEVRSHWDVYVEEFRGTRLAYLVKEACGPADTEADFFVNVEDAHGARHVAFSFGFWGVAAGTRCVAAVELPETAVNSLEVGQYDVWRSSVAFR